MAAVLVERSWHGDSSPKPSCPPRGAVLGLRHFSLVSLGGKIIMLWYMGPVPISPGGTTRSVEGFPMGGGDTVVAPDQGISAS